MAYTDKERAEILAAARLINARAKYLDAPVSAVPAKTATAVFEKRVPRKGGTRTGDTSITDTLSYLDSNLDAIKGEAK